MDFTQNPSVIGGISDTLYITGIRREVNQHLLEKCMQEIGLEFDAIILKGGKCWMKFSTHKEAQIAIRKLSIDPEHLNGACCSFKHTKNLLKIQRKGLSVRFEYGVDPETGKRIVHQKNEPRPIKKIEIIDNTSERPSQVLSTFQVTYHNDSLGIQNGISELRYPFPTGRYLYQLTQKCYQIYKETHVDLFYRFFGSSHNKGPKDLTECLGIIHALHRVIDHLNLSCSYEVILGNVYVLGDGKDSLLGQLLQLYSHKTAFEPNKIHSIDPIAQVESVNNDLKHPSLFPIKSMSQDYRIQPPSDPSHITLVLSCHSHAPLQEFWDRIKSNKLSISMPCCSDYGLLKSDERNTILFEYEDYEVASAKRKIIVFENSNI